MRRTARDCNLVGCRVLARCSAVPTHGLSFCSSLLTATAKSGTVGVTASSLATLPFTATQLSWPTLARRQPVRACSLELAGWHAALHEVCASQSVDVGEVCPAAPVAWRIRALVRAALVCARLWAATCVPPSRCGRLTATGKAGFSLESLSTTRCVADAHARLHARTHARTHAYSRRCRWVSHATAAALVPSRASARAWGTRWI